MSGRNTASGCFLFLLACGSTQPSTTDVGIEQGAADASTLVDVANFDALDRQDSSTQIDAGTLCSTGDALCDGQCVRLASNASHCGSCNAACATAQLCLSGSCVESCPTSAVACDGHCVNAQTDAQNCGGCGIACPGTQVCNAGACGCASGTQCQSACVNIENDPANCGACGHACVASEVCAQGSCQTSCATDRTGCQRSCVDLSNDRQNCGACATMCAGGASCQAGICLCDGTSVLCGDACVDTARDPQHCGACGMACSPGQACVASRCVSGCPTGQVACGGTCVDPNRDRNNCGGCGIACGAACNRGACVEPVATVGVYALHARMSDGSVYTWPADGSAEPSPVQGLSDVALLRGESGAQCALTTNHQILCWGHNEWGQLGIGNRVPIVATPTLVTALPPNFVPVDVERGRAFTCALSTTGLVRCWGTSYSRAVGIDSLAPQLDSVAIALPSPAIDIGVGFETACAVLQDRSLVCWGRILGPEIVNIDVSASAVSAGLGNLISVDVGDERACGVTSTRGDVVCVGRGMARPPNHNAPPITDFGGTATAVEAPSDPFSIGGLRNARASVVAVDTDGLAIATNAFYISLATRNPTATPTLGVSTMTSMHIEGPRSCGVSQGAVYCIDPNDTPSRIFLRSGF